MNHWSQLTLTRRVYGLFASVRWAAGLVETWKGSGMPKWPRWRK